MSILFLIFLVIAVLVGVATQNLMAALFVLGFGIVVKIIKNLISR